MGIYGLHYAYGPPGTVEHAIPVSAFSEGDLVMYDSASSLSRINELCPSGMDIAGVALSASTASYRNKVPYLIPHADTIFWSECTTGSQFTPGEEFDFEYTSARFMLTTSANSVRATVQRGTQDISGQTSTISRVLIKLIQHAGNFEHS